MIKIGIGIQELRIRRFRRLAQINYLTPQYDLPDLRDKLRSSLREFHGAGRPTRTGRERIEKTGERTRIVIASRKKPVLVLGRNDD